MANPTVRLFVYGSLKRGGRHHDQLGAAAYLGAAATRPGYRLEALDDGEYLALVEDGSSAVRVNGELFEVPEARLTALDAFEGDAYLRGYVGLEKGGFALAYLKKAR